MACAWLLQATPACFATQAVVALLPLPVVVQVQVQLSYALSTKLPCKFTGACVEMGAGAIKGGFSATSICTIRLEPGFWPSLGVTASEVSNQTGVACGVISAHVGVKADKGSSWVPFQQTCCPARAALLTFWGGWVGDPSTPVKPIKFCLLVTRTHLNARALAPPSPGISVVVSVVGELK